MSEGSSILLRPVNAWNQFFHRQADLSIFGPIRIGFAALLLFNVLMWWPDLDKWFGEDGVLTLERSRMVIDPDAITLFQWLPKTSAVLWTCYLLLIANLVGLLIGLFTRIHLIFVFVLFTSFAHRNNLIMDGEDVLFRMMAFYLLFSPAGEYFSVSSWWRSKRAGSEKQTKTYGIWPLRLIQIQTSSILFFSGFEKMKGTDWTGGTALYYVSRLDDLFCRLPVPEFIFTSLPLIAVLSWATLVVEVCLPVAVWYPRTRRIALLFVLAFHLSLDYAMNLNLFQWLMLVGWMSFVSREDFGSFKKYFGTRT